MLPTKAAPRILQGGMLELEQLAESESQNCSPETICACVAKTFGVRTNEVALLESSGSLLKFLYPSELKSAGVIPISSSAAAARTARTRRADLFNTFTRVQHSSVFEVVKLGDAGTDTDVIQKLMSAPIFSPSEKVICNGAADRRLTKSRDGIGNIGRAKHTEAVVLQNGFA